MLNRLWFNSLTPSDMVTHLWFYQQKWCFDQLKMDVGYSFGRKWSYPPKTLELNRKIAIDHWILSYPFFCSTKSNAVWKCTYDNIPVVPHKAMAEVSNIGNL
jgi:hypothetical protein